MYNASVLCGLSTSCDNEVLCSRHTREETRVTLVSKILRRLRNNHAVYVPNVYIFVKYVHSSNTVWRQAVLTRINWRILPNIVLT